MRRTLWSSDQRANVAVGTITTVHAPAHATYGSSTHIWAIMLTAWHLGIIWRELLVDGANALTAYVYI